MRALITGVTGFVGQYLAESLLDHGMEVLGTTRSSSPSLYLNKREVPLFRTEFKDKTELLDLLKIAKPDVIFHLAGQSNVRMSWLNKEQTIYTNLNQSVFLLDACVEYQKYNSDFSILTIGSSEEYGAIQPNHLPIKEETALRPMSPYGASKAALSMLVQQYHKAHGLKVMHARPFNHIGPGQGLGFVVPDFAVQIANIEKNKQEPVIEVGNLSAARDFTDVRDIVQAYRTLIFCELFGEAFNVCSGKAVKMQDILDSLLSLSSIQITLEEDPKRLRPSDIPEHFGSNQKIFKTTGWTPKYSLQISLSDILDSFRAQMEEE